MIEQKLLEYYQSLGKEFHLLLEALLSQKSGKQLHPLRVNLKKQLALFDLLATLDEGFALKTVPKPAKKIMKATSTLRDARVGAQLANIFEQHLLLTPRFSKRIKAEQKSRLKSSLKVVNKIPISQVQAVEGVVNECLNNLSGRVDLWPRLHHYYHDQTDLVRRIGESILEKEKEKNLHRFRKALKALMFNLLLLKKLAPELRALKPVLKSFDEFQSLLGDWNDRVVLLEKMRKDKRKVSKALKQLVKHERLRLFFDILEKLEGFSAFCLEIQQHLYELFAKPVQEKMEKKAAFVPTRINRKVERFPSPKKTDNHQKPT